MTNHKDRRITDNEEETKPTIERHLQTIIVGISMTLLVWVGYTLTRNVETVARIDVQVKNLQNTIKDIKIDLKESNTSRYTWQNAQSDRQTFEYKLQVLRDRVTRVENQLDKKAIKQGGP